MSAGLRLGIDLGGTHVKMALVMPDGRVTAVQRVDTPKTPRAVVRSLRSALNAWRGQRLAGTGVGVAGDVDATRGFVRFAPNLGWRNVPLRKLFRRARFPSPLFFDNDANAAAWGAYRVELHGRTRHLVVLTLGTGVGGGLILDGRLHHGATGSAGELGHIVIDPGGPRCGCGSRGCLETYVGGLYLTRHAREEARRRGRAISSALSPLDLYRMARRGDPLAKNVWDRAGRALGIGLANLINLLNPDTILLCGGVAGAASLLLRRARPEIARAFRTPRAAARIRVAREKDHLGVIGAALLVP